MLDNNDPVQGKPVRRSQDDANAQADDTCKRTVMRGGEATVNNSRLAAVLLAVLALVIAGIMVETSGIAG
jgi:hypothetical protein